MDELLRTGDKVRTWFDTGAMGAQILYGLVIASGPKRATVLWESGLCNRILQCGSRVERATDKEWQECNVKIPN